MAGVGRFEDLVAWQKARVLVREIYRVSRSGDLGRDYRFAGQIQRAAVSVMSNIAEGFERGGSGEFHQFLSIAKASCAEVRSQLYIASDIGYLGKNDFLCLMNLATKVTRIIGGLRASVERQRNRKQGARK